MKTPNGRDEIEQVFGNPAKSNGMLNEAWEAEFIRRVPPPNGWQLYYQDDKKIVQVSGIRIHRLLRDSFIGVLDEIWDFAKIDIGNSATDEKIRLWLHANRLDLHGGGFNFRPITGGTGLSLHSYGIAIDWDPIHNPRKKPLTGTLPDWWYSIWAKFGWSDGRHFKVPDPMHVQFATGA
jgi:hypothetical protein